MQKQCWNPLSKIVKISHQLLSIVNAQFVTTTNNCALLLKRAVIKKVATGQKKCNKMNLEQRDVREVVFVLCTLYFVHTRVVPGTHTP